MSVLENQNLIELIYNDILMGILKGDFTPGSRFPTEARLSQDYGISRAVVRLVLQKLKDEALILSKQGSGSIVAPLTEQRRADLTTQDFSFNLRQSFECRIALEGEIAALAAERCTDPDKTYFRAHLEQMEAALGSGIHDTAEDAQFHGYLAKMVANSYFDGLMASLRPAVLLSMNSNKALSEEYRLENAQFSLHEHRAVIEAIRNHDSEGAREAMRKHLQQALDRLFARDQEKRF